MLEGTGDLTFQIDFAAGRLEYVLDEMLNEEIIVLQSNWAISAEYARVSQVKNEGLVRTAKESEETGRIVGGESIFLNLVFRDPEGRFLRDWLPTIGHCTGDCAQKMRKSLLLTVDVDVQILCLRHVIHQKKTAVKFLLY